MIETLVSVGLPADEVLTIKKNSLKGVGCEDGKRIAVVTGIHGDELEGQYVCYELVRKITANMSYLKGTVDIYNPKTIRATMGSLYRVPFVYMENLEEAVSLLKKSGITTYAAHLKGEKFFHVPTSCLSDYIVTILPQST